MVKLINQNKEILAKLYSDLSNGNILNTFNVIVDTLENNNKDEIEAIFNSYIYMFYSLKNKHLDSYKTETLYTLKERFDIPIKEMLEIIKDLEFRKYLIATTDGIKCFLDSEHDKALDKFEEAYSIEKSYETSHYYLCLISSIKLDIQTFTNNYTQLSRQTRKIIDEGLNQRNLFIPSFPPNFRYLLTELIRNSNSHKLIIETGKEIIQKIEQANIDVKEHVTGESNRIIDTLGEKIDCLLSNVSTARQEILKTINNREEAITAIMQAVLTELNNFKTNVSKDELTRADKRLEEMFGKEIWENENLLTEDSKVLLKTSEVIYNYLFHFETFKDVDFSPAVIPLTKALENELYRHFFVKLKSFCLSKLGVYNVNWPQPLIYLKKPSNQYVENTWPFTLGSVIKILDDRNFKKNVKREFFATYYKSTFNVYEFRKDVISIKDNYRDIVAHKDGLKIVDAINCREEMIAVKKSFVKYLKNIK